MIYYTN